MKRILMYLLNVYLFNVIAPRFADDLGGDAHDRREQMQDFLGDESNIAADEIEEEEEEEEVESGSVADGTGDDTEIEGEGDEEEGGLGDDEVPEGDDAGDGTDSIEESELSALQDHSEAFQGLVEALDETDYPVDFTDTSKGMEEVGLRLSDAHHLYDILNGKEQATDKFFDRVLKFQGQQAHDFVLTEVLEYAKRKGLIESTDTDDSVKDGDINDPVAKENKQLKERLKALEGNRAQEGQRQATEVAATRQRKIFNSAVTELKRIASERNGIDEDDINDFLVPAMAKGVGGNKAVLNRIARGNFVDIQRIADGVINRLIAKRVERNKSKVESRKVRDQKVPKRVAGGNAPGAASGNFDLGTSEGRRAAAKASLRG
jgi:hypothetical protein